MKPLPGKLRIGDWTVEPSLNRISRGDQVRPLSHKVMATLVYLAEHPGAVHSKEQLIGSIWRGRATSDEVLTTVVYELRKALDDDARKPRYIETIRKGGYRLIAEVSPATTVPSATTVSPETEKTAPTAAGQPTRGIVWLLLAMVVLAALVGIRGWLAPPSAQAPATLESITVRPFSTFIEECRQDFFADGLTAMLVAELAAAGDLTVLTEAAPWPGFDPSGEIQGPPSDGDAQIADTQTADARVEGTVVRTGDRLWISVQLVERRAAAVLWSGSYERQARGESLSVQQDLAREIAAEIEARIAQMRDR